MSKAARDCHFGRGVNISSYKNARRLAVTETNIAYRTSDHLRWQQQRKDGSPKANAVRLLTDICDTLAGRYPKDFKFTGWHPHCPCHAVTILKTEDEMAEDTQRILAGEQLDGKNVNRVDDVPDNFKLWLEDNGERAKRSYSMPYFIKDNPKYLPTGYSKLYAMKMPYDTYEEYTNAMVYNRKHAAFSDGITHNNRELAALLPVMQGKIMNFTEADRSRCNPNYSLSNAKDLGYWYNCQTCTMTYELRRRGFNVEAEANPVVNGYKKYWSFDKYCNAEGMKWYERYLTEDGKVAGYEWSSGIKDTKLAKLKFIEDKTDTKGRYEIYCAWKGKNAGAHVFIVERQKDGNLLWFDPHSGRWGSWQDFNDYINQMKPGSIGVLRIDDKLINTKFSARFKATSD